MKKVFYFAFFALLFSCSTDKEIKTVKVSFPEAGTNFISWLDIFPDVEMIALTGEHAPMFAQRCHLFIHDNVYYVADFAHTNKVHRFDRDGRYLNSIGTQGRGPEEYTSLYDVLVDNRGNVVVHPFGAGEGAVIVYSQDGIFLEKIEHPYISQKFFSHNGFNYHYTGVYTDQEYRLYVTDNNGQTVGEFLPQPPSAPLNYPNFQTFSLYNDAVSFCPPEGDDIYRLKDGKMEVKYRFDFGNYHITDEYYKAGPVTLRDFLASNTIAIKESFSENGHCAVLFVTIQGAIELPPTFVMGVLDKKKDLWRWFNWDESNFMQIPLYFDEGHVYFLASAELMREEPGLAERFPLLNTISEGNDTVILKCRTDSVKL